MIETKAIRDRGGVIRWIFGFPILEFPIAIGGQKSEDRIFK